MVWLSLGCEGKNFLDNKRSKEGNWKEVLDLTDLAAEGWAEERGEKCT